MSVCVSSPHLFDGKEIQNGGSEARESGGERREIGVNHLSEKNIVIKIPVVFYLLFLSQSYSSLFLLGMLYCVLVSMQNRVWITQGCTSFSMPDEVLKLAL